MENPRRGRRSFVDVRRKSLTLSNIFSEENGAPPVCDKSKHSIKTYLDSLITEKQDWKDVIKQKKINCKESKKNYEYGILSINSKDVEKYLGMDNKKFIENKPDYLAMAKSVRKYIDAVNYLKKYKVDIVDSCNKACNVGEINTKLLVDEMCSNEICDICNNINCHLPNHKFSV